MQNIYLKLMQEFEETGLSSKRSISKFMARNFIKPKSDIKDTWIRENQDASSFLEDVKNTGHFVFYESQKYDIIYSDIVNERRWFDVVDIDARLTIKGLEFWEAHKTNNRLNKNSILQTRILMLTGFIALCGTCITIYGINQNDFLDKQKRQLEVQSTQINALQIELSKLTDLKFHELLENKTLPKK